MFRPTYCTEEKGRRDVDLLWQIAFRPSKIVLVITKPNRVIRSSGHEEPPRLPVRHLAVIR
jgi:hypothetical protein